MKILNSVDLKALGDFFEEVISGSSGYDIYIGGGYIRDLYFNKLNNCNDMVPKDVDLFFVPAEGDKQLPTIVKSFVNYDKSSSEIPDMEERGVDSVRGLFVPRLETKDVQFIAYKRPMSQINLAADMDCNINQVMVDIKTGVAVATDAFFSGHDNEKIEMLHDFNFVRMGKRLARMSDKFPGYTVAGDWNLEDFAKKARVEAGSFCDTDE